MMLTSMIQTSHSALQNLPLNMPDDFKTKVAVPRNPKLTKREEKGKKLSPSIYAHEMSQTTEERLANTHTIHPPRILELLDMSETTHHKFSVVDVDQPLFQPYPSEIVFQNYLPSKTYEVPLVLRNNDKIPRLVKVTEEDSLYFKVVSPVDVCNKVAPGMASTFTVVFTPQENKDYIHRLICVTEREKFEVPIRAIGPRAILDFPDDLHFTLCPVKCLAQKTLLVRNIGKSEAKFQLSTQNPFSVEPSVATLGVGESIQVSVDFLPRTTGDHSQQMLLLYHTGESIYINLYGASTDVNVRFDKNSVLLEKTYISMTNQRTVTILNRSDSIVHYQWKNFATEEEEEQNRLRSCSELQQEKDDEMEQFLTECGADPTLRHRLSLLSRTFQQRHRQLRLDNLAFSDQHIILEPQEGDIWPNRTAEITVIFKPQEAKLYQHTVYCDVTGRESRLPLRIKGEGMGPKLQFNFDLLDIGNIFVGSKHSYEVLVSNKGLIDAPYKVEPPTTAMGLCFSFSPSEGVVPHGACHALEVRFSSDILGTFSEEIHFTVVGNPQPLSLTFRGCVMGPTFQFSIPELNFGEVSYGCPHTVTCSLSNTSLVSMSFGLRIPRDGTQRDSVTSAEQVSQLDRNDWRPGNSASERPREFTVTPSSGTIRAQSQMDIKVTLCSNTVQQYSLALVVDVQGVGEEVLALPIKARCVVPEVYLENHVLQFQHCFLGYPYEQSIRLINDSSLPACYGLLAQEYEENPALLFSSPHPRGIIKPYSAELIPLVLQAKRVGQLQLTALLAILGQEGPPLELLLTCNGQGPAVTLSATEMNFGTIFVLTDISRTLQVSNQSPIPACFKAQMVRSKSQWRVEPVEGEVFPEEQVELKLVVNLDDTLPFRDKLQLAIQDSQTFIVPVSATGKGTTIVTDRPFAPSLNLGSHFSPGPCQYHFKVTNRGRRFHQLIWGTEGFPQSHHRDPPPTSSSRVGKAKSLLSLATQGSPAFSLTPVWLELAPGQSADMLLEVSSSTPKIVREKLICHAIVGHQTRKERIMTVEATCRFIAPILDISSQQLNFYVEKVPGMSLVPLYKRLYLKNISTLALSLELTLAHPFGLCDFAGDESFTTSKSLVVGVGAKAELWVRFDPSYWTDLVSRVAEEVMEVRYIEHPQRDTVALRGEVHFPNLHFSSIVLHFGCILNHTGVQREVMMTNCSPLPVTYRWAFLLDLEQYHFRNTVIPTSQCGEERPNEKMDLNEKRGESLKELLSTSDITAVDGQVNSVASTAPKTFKAEQELNTASLTLQARELDIGIEEVFDILPLYGVLQPGESQLVTFSFFGHSNISAQVLALCEVEEGPTYEISLMGESSVVSYQLDTTDIDFGLRLFDHVAETEITLKNTGKVGFEFSALVDNQQIASHDILLGQPLVMPSTGHIKANEETSLTVYYLPGIPEVFEKTFQIQVAFFEPECITLRGEGIFPRVCLDLPRNLNAEQYSSVLKEAKEAIENECQREEVLSRPATEEGEMCELDHIPTYDALLQMEVEKLLVKENSIAIEKSQRESEQREVSGSTTSRWRKKLSRFVLPEYILDFGYVISGTVPTHIIKVTNTGPVPVSFRAERRSLASTGFSTELDRVMNLPYCETETFEVKFDPHGLNLVLGEISTVLPIQVLGGPMVHVHLRAVVTMPSLTISTDMLQFDNVQCGMCKVVSVQLHNPEPVPCEWSSREEEPPKRKFEKHAPLHMRQKARLEQPPSPVIFEMVPSSGVLYPGERFNVQVKFSPSEGKMYRERLVVVVAQSTHKILIVAQGLGEEPQLEFSTLALELGPVLPYSNGEEAEVLVHNPCPFPIEFYSLDFDKQYLEEEKILRMMKGYDEQNVLLLPPRAPGESLPSELLDYYKDHSSQEQEPSDSMVRAAREKNELTAPAEECSLEEDMANATVVSQKDGMSTGVDLVKDNFSGVSELEVNPVMQAVTRHVGSYLSQADRIQRGIAIIVHGAPLSGKTGLAVSLARYYGAAYLSIDSVVQEALSGGTSIAALQARALCGITALEPTVGTLEEPDVMCQAGQDVGFLSVEAVARHTAEGAQATDPKTPTSTISARNKTSTIAVKRNDGSNPTAASTAGQVYRLPCENLSQMGESGSTNNLLPETLLLQILSERLKLSDCHRGIVIDGLETLYCCSPSTMLHAILRAFNNRKHIYVIDLSNDYNNFKAGQRAQVEAEEALLREQREKEELRLLEMNEDEYDALSAEEKERIDLQQLEVLKKLKRREQKILGQQQEEKKQPEERAREQVINERNKKVKKESSKEESSGKRSQLGGKQSVLALHPETRQEQNLKDGRKMSLYADGKESKDLLNGAGKRNIGDMDSPLPLEELEREHETETERQLLARFHLYEQSQLPIQQMLQCWDRTETLVLCPLTPQEQIQGPEDTPAGQTLSGKKAKREREKEKMDKEKTKTEKSDGKLISPVTSPVEMLSSDTVGLKNEQAPNFIPHICISVNGKEHPSMAELLSDMKLPFLEEVLDGLGLGPRGPPISPPMLFSVVPYPKKRLVSSRKTTPSYFTFLMPSSSEDMAVGDREVDLEPEAVSSAVSAKEDVTSLTKGKGKKALVKAESPKERPKDKQRTPSKKERKSTEPNSPQLNTTTPLSDTTHDKSVEDKLSEHKHRLTNFRWVVPPKGQVTQKLWFNSTVPGKFDQTLSFEVMGTKRCYQLYCSGICAFPSISKDYKTVFANCKKVLQPDDGLQNTYIVRSGVYNFGALLCGKTRGRYQDNKCSENTERLVIHNNSPMEAEVYFCFEHDTKASTFSLDPLSMILKPNEKRELRIWAYPTTTGLIEDKVVCCIKENPEPAIFQISCRGVRPELEVERKQLHFDKIPLHRKETRSLCLRNPTALPVAWRLGGLEVLGDEFSVSQSQGIIMPHSEFYLIIHFRAMKPVNLKKAIRLEVSDAGNILGTVHTENIHFVAEAYDFDLDITFPKGADGVLDFGTIKVGEEVKLSVTLKNKGKYEMAYKFILEPTLPGMPNLNSVFTVTPQKGCLHPTERPTGVQFICHYTKEVSIREQPILHCQVFEPNVADGGETVAVIPIKVSVQSLFARYSIFPCKCLHFGALIYGCRKMQTFTVENKGDFEMHFTISRICNDLRVSTQKRSTGKRPSSQSMKLSTDNKLRRSDSTQKDTTTPTQARLTAGLFVLSPCFGVIPPGGQQVVSVDCVADQIGDWEECLAVDITDRDPSDSPGGIPYRLMADVCVPEIAYKDTATIFEEHRLCQNSNMLHCEQYREAKGIYIQDENKFIFNNVLVGQSAKARFRLTNPGKVPCELNLQVKAITNPCKVTVHSSEVFELTPTRLCIPSHSHAFATITFTPQTMQTYLGVFEASLEGTNSLLSLMKTKLLVFDLMGEGNLPCITILKPVQRSNRGQPVLHFKRLLVGRKQTLSLVIKNTSNVLAQVSIDLFDKTRAFALREAPGTVCINICSSHIENDLQQKRQMAHAATLTLMAGQQVEFEVEFHPEVAQSFEAKMLMMVKDNQYDETLVQLLGEGFCDIISLENISTDVSQDQHSTDARCDVLHFRDCHVGRLYHRTFTMRNHSNSEVLRFEWPQIGPHLRFSPQTGHLHAGCSKEVTVSFSSEQPVMLSTQVVKCKLCRITFQQPVDQVQDWDDRLRTIKWVDLGMLGSTQQTAKKVVEADPEPVYTVVENSSREIELQVIAMCDYAKFECDAESIHFEDTLLYQTRLFQMQMFNKGTVQLEYSWQVMMEAFEKTLHRDMTSCSAQGSQIGLRPSSTLGSMSALLLGDPDLPPFSVEPSLGLIQPGESQTFYIRFSPLEVADYEARLICSVPNLKDSQSPVIEVNGRSVLTCCYFHLEDSDYLSGGRRNPELSGPLGAPLKTSLDPKTKVIEFISMAVGTSVCREFSIVNPTNQPYSVLWRCEDLDATNFTCLTPKDTIQPGKKVEVSFLYQAKDVKLNESFWTFVIPEYKFSVPFLLVGTANDPAVYVDQSYINLGSQLIGCEVRKTVHVVNGEDQPFHFAIVETSCHSETLRDSLIVKPMEGTVPARDKFPLVVSFTPKQEGAVTFNLRMVVRGKVQPLSVNVKADSYSMHACAQYESHEGTITKLSATDVQLVDFKQVELGGRSTCAFVVSNTGNVDLDVQYELTGPVELHCHIQVEPKTAVVPVGQQNRVILTFFPVQKCSLQNICFLIKVKNGPIFRCSLRGSTASLGLEFSFLKYNFGMKFIFSMGMVPATHTLFITNKGEKGTSVNCLFSNTPFLEVSFTPEVLLPGDSMEVLFTFYPREAVRYHEKVAFEINNYVKQVVEITGQGIEMKLELEDPKQKVMKLGTLQVCQKSRRLIPLINNSPSSLTFSLLLTPFLHTLMDSRVLSVSPYGNVTLKGGGGKCVVEVIFSPEQRMAPFTEQIQLECLGTVRPLLVLKGCCHGVEVALDQDYLSFGAVVQCCKTTQRIVLQNTGDIGARFQWDVKSFAPDFNICPAEGYICPGMEVPLEVVFTPVKVTKELHYNNLCCSIEGGKPVTLSLTGTCIASPVSNQVVNFVCQVRSQCTQALTLSNRTNQHWSLKPVIEGEYWSASSTFIIEPYQQNKAYEITYKPLTMTTDGKKHLGSVFFSFPDGSGMLYTLQGTAEPPKAVGTISHEVPCKTSYTEIVSVHNWLSKPQRFHAIMEIMKPERHDSTVSLKGLDYVDVPSLAKQDHKICFCSYKEGQYNAKLTFKNEATGEYQFYYLNFKAIPPGVISTIEMVTVVRQVTSASVQVENPLPTNQVLTAECRSTDISVNPQFSVPALSKETLMFEYQPLRSGETTERLTLHNSELGFFYYELLLRALPAPHEKPLYFRAPLGSGQYLTAKFTNYSRVKAEYTCKTDCPDFVVEKNITVAAGYQTGSEVSVEVYFEPCQLGEVRGLLTVSSSLGGDYTFPLHGTCSPPKVQGPLAIRAGSSVSIPFKNVFLQTTAFSFQVDNPAFSIKGVESIRSKKTSPITVSFEGPQTGSKASCTGKMIITSPRTEGHGQSLCWIYYLKGFCPEQAQREKTS